MKTLQKFSLCVLLVCISYAGYSQRYLSEIFGPDNVTTEYNITFGKNYQPRSVFAIDSFDLIDLKLDVYQPSQSVDTVEERPLMIYLHTGNFIAPPNNGSPVGRKEDLCAIEMCRRFARRGYVAASINYRLNWNPISQQADERRGTLLRAVFRAIIDAKSAVRFFKNDYANGNQYHIDPNKIVMFGEGSGGYVSLAYATLDRFEEISIAKFLDANNQPVLDTNKIGNFDGFGGSQNYDNYSGVNADVQFIVNIGGALADTSWLEVGDAPMVSFQCPRDPFAPYLDGTVIVPTTNENVVDVQGAGVFMKKAVAIGNNDVFVNANLNDPISQLARTKYNQTITYWDAVNRPTISTAGDEGLYPFILPLTTNQLENQASPWQFWDPTSELATTVPFGSSLTAHQNGLISNPDMSWEKAMAYIDTIQWYLHPRIQLGLSLDTTTTYNDPTAGEPDSITFSFYSSIRDLSNKLEEVEIDIYPNPASETLVLKLNDPALRMESYEIYNLSGQLLSQNRITDSQNFKINRNGLSSGIYFIHIRYDSNQSSVHKVIFE